MPSINFLLFFQFFSLLSFLINFTRAVDPTYRYHFCPNTTTFTSNSTYESNLNFFLSSLVPNDTRSNGFSNGYFNATAGQDPNRVYGNFLCRGDVSSESCQDCVTFAARDVKQRCPFQKENIIWYDECLLRYSDESFFSTMTTNPSVVLMNSNNNTDPNRFFNVVGGLMRKGADQAVSSPKRFATTKKNITTFQTIYCLVQCTPDLSSSDCDRCLTETFSGLRTTQVGSRVLSPSCNSRFEIYPFYNESAIATPAPPPSPLSPKR